MPVTSTTNSPPDPGFTPRKEFIRDQQSPPNTFAILALSSSNFIRLYSFSPSVIDGLQRLFERQGIDIACREDAPQNLWELSIDQKPWANPKSVLSEKLLLDIFTVVYQANYTFLSCIDYGREPDDRLAMAFSQPSCPTPSRGSRTGTPPLPGGSPALDGSNMSLPETVKKARRIPFALSFSSTTVMRVISPPLHLTPAILQAVRASWPRGVVSEKKVGDNCFEFKLKGYKWFQQDNFAFDSLQHILSLLTSLDAQSFTLLTSLSLTNRSRVKDLWIFTGPAPVGVGASRQEDHDLVAEPPRTLGEGSGAPSSLHRRLTSEVVLPTQLTLPHHSRSATEGMSQRHRSNSTGTASAHLLRKPAPRAQVPVSVVQESGPDGYDELGYGDGRLPSIISSDSPNMTGIGAIGQGQDLYAFRSIDRISPHGGPPYPPFTPSISRASRSPSSDRSSRPVSEGATTPPLFSHSAPSSPQRYKSGFKSEINHTYEANANFASPIPRTLLSPGTFRDSGLSSQTDISQDIPIKWTGTAKENTSAPSRLRSGSVSSSKFPGGWHGTPFDEVQEDAGGLAAIPKPTTMRTPIHETLSRVESPEVVQPNVALRQSEAVIFGMIAATSPSPPPPLLPPPPPLPRSPIFQPDRVPSKTSEKSSKKDGGPHSGQGWVLVNVEGSRAASPSAESSTRKAVASREAYFQHPASNISAPNLNRSPLPQEQPTHAAKAIVVMDALDSKHKKSRSTATNRELGEGGASVRRFFSLNRKNSRKSEKQRERTISGSEANASTTISRFAIRDRLRVLGTPEASRRDDK